MRDPLGGGSAHGSPGHEEHAPVGLNDLELAKKELAERGLAFVLVKNGSVRYRGTRSGIVELLEAAQAHPDEMRGAALADRIVGRAVAFIARTSGIRSVFATLASEGGVEVLRAGGIPVSWERLTPYIENRRKDGMCPLEKLASGHHDPRGAVAALREFVRRG